jgi:hypothetical protein
MGGACGTNEGDEHALVIGGKARSKKRLLGRPRVRWVDNKPVNFGESEVFVRGKSSVKM